MSTSPNVNTVTLVGRLTADPALSRMSDGGNVCDLQLAVNDCARPGGRGIRRRLLRPSSLRFWF
jgi:single-stranded DNA-binding protein